MPPKRVPSSSATPPSVATPSRPTAAQTPTKRSTTTPATTPHKPTPSTPASRAGSSAAGGAQDAQAIVRGIAQRYADETPQRTKLLDVFLAFLVVVGALQFVYCVVAGNYPFNAFLSGFGATVGQFVLTASLRIQTNPDNKGEFKNVSPERAFADFVLGSLILHFFCINFIN